MSKNFDAVIVGGGIIGTATGYYLAKRGLKVLLLEKDYLTAGSTGRCITGIRQQFSTPATIKTAMESVRLFRDMKDEFDMDVQWSSSGYLFLAHDQEMASMFQKNIALQQQFGLDVRFLDAGECRALIPKLNDEGLVGGAWCPSDGQADPFLVVRGYTRGIANNGGVIRIGTPVTRIVSENGRVRSVVTAGGDTFQAPRVLIAAGAFARETGQTAGVNLDVTPERHQALITDGVQYEKIPMLVDYRPDGGYFVQRLTGQFIGCFTPEKQVPGHDIDSTLDFIVEMSRRMCKLIPALEKVAVLRQWAGSYAMTPDGSPIVDETEIRGLYCAVGMCGHGFMLGPALGKYLAQFMTEGSWEIPMNEFAYGRRFGEMEKMK